MKNTLFKIYINTKKLSCSFLSDVRAKINTYSNRDHNLLELFGEETLLFTAKFLTYCVFHICGLCVTVQCDSLNQSLQTERKLFLS